MIHELMIEFHRPMSIWSSAVLTEITDTVIARIVHCEVSEFLLSRWAAILFDEPAGHEKQILDREPAESDVPALKVITFNTSAAIASRSLAVQLHLDNSCSYAECSFSMSCFMKAGKFRRIEDDRLRHSLLSRLAGAWGIERIPTNSGKPRDHSPDKKRCRFKQAHSELPF